jgi:Fic family protein
MGNHIMQYNWQHPDWPHFTYDASHGREKIQQNLLAYTALANRLAGSVSSLAKTTQHDALLDIMIDEALKNAAIEGVTLNPEDLRSSLKNQLGLNKPLERVGDPRADNMARLVLLVRETFDADLTKETLCDWQRLAVSEPRLKDIRLGDWRNDSSPMQIVSGPIGLERVHYEAPPAAIVPTEMSQFIDWFNTTHPKRGTKPLNGVIRAALAHMYFESIHPFEDGNGRVGRALAEKALSQDLGAPVLYSLSGAMERSKKNYYTALEQASGYCVNVTSWVVYFTETVLAAQQYSEETIRFVLAKAKYFTDHTAPLNARQQKAITRMFEAGHTGFAGGMSAGKYASLTKTSKPTATRDLVYLLEHGYLSRLPGGGRGTKYALNLA